MKFLRCVLGLAALLFVLSATATSVLAQSADGEAAADDALLQEAKQYAAQFGVDLEEAVFRLRLQPAIGELQAELAASEPASFAGLWIEHTPSFRVIVQHTQGGGQRLQDHLQAEGRRELAGVVEQRTVRHSLKRLEAIHAAARRIAKAQGIPVDSSVSVADNRIDLRTTLPTDLGHALQQAAKTRKDAAEVLENAEIIAVESLMVPEAYVHAGLQVTACTSGYAVQSANGTLGVTTAAHCGDTQQYNGRSLPLQGQLHGGSYDVQWHTAPGLHVDNRIYDGITDTTPNYRYVAGTKSRAQQFGGEYVCKYGVATGYTCGTIDRTDYQPDFEPNPAATYIYVKGGSVDLSKGGDSGGPWFYGDTAYGIHSGGGVEGTIYQNDSIYMPIDFVSGLGVSVLTTTPQVNVGRWTYRNTGDNPTVYTGINANEYECGVAGLAALNGDIREADTGNIIQSYLFKENDHWKIRGDFRTHNNGESWDFDLLCLKKSVYPVTRVEYRNLGDSINYNTYLSTTTYECGVGGLAALDGDIQEHDTGDILQAYMYASGGTWWIRADFRTHNNQESWNVDALCVERWAPVQKYRFTNLGDNPTYNTYVSSSTHECGVAGFQALNGDINENDTGDIMRAYVYSSGGTWWIRSDFRTHNNNETWNVDMLCVQR